MELNKYYDFNLIQVVQSLSGRLGICQALITFDRLLIKTFGWLTTLEYALDVLLSEMK